jgi:Flp pilus assembly protein TadG
MRKVNGFAKSKSVSSAARSAGKRVRACLRKGDEGNTIVEMALMLPILLTVMLGIFVLGTIMMNYRALYQAVGDGSDNLQALAKDAAGTDVCAKTWALMTAVAPTLNPSQLTVTVTLGGSATPGSGTPHTMTGASGSCTSDSVNMSSGTYVSVSAKYPCNFVIYGKDYSGGSCQISTTPSTQILP